LLSRFRENNLTWNFQVYVCGSLANLYFKTSSDQDWQLKFTGIPVVVLDIGESRARDKRRIQIALAERGTCFMLWNDTIDNLSSYQVAGNAFHTMCCSSDHTKQVGFSFDTAQAANDMWTHIERLVSCPENISLSIPGMINGPLPYLWRPIIKSISREKEKEEREKAGEASASSPQKPYLAAVLLPTCHFRRQGWYQQILLPQGVSTQ
jgi:hypothetical protein